MSMVTVLSSHGTITMSWPEGYALRHDLDDCGDCGELSRISKFDVAEWQRFHANCCGDNPPEELDILDLAYWYKDEDRKTFLYEGAEPEWRQPTA